MVPVKPAASGLAAVGRPAVAAAAVPAPRPTRSGGGRAEPGRLQEVSPGDARHDRPAGLPR